MTDTENTADNLTRRYSLAIWAKENSEPYEATQEKSQIALKLAIEGINDGSIESLDGFNSPLAREIKEHHGVDQFEMNRNWIETSQRWKCPCCNRGKFEISRIGNKGQILAKLVEHHDHIEDALKASFNRVFVETGTEIPTTTGLALVERMAPAFSAYSPVLICEDCNNADAAAKKIITTAGDRITWHSFSIQQIKTFITIKEHSSHIVIDSKVISLWRLVRPAYVARMQLVHKVATAAVLQDYWFEGYQGEGLAVPTLSNGFQRFNGLELVSGSALCLEMEKSNIVHPRYLSRWRTEGKPIDNQPPTNYLAMLLSLPGCARMWNALEDNWRCPICERSKYEVVSFAKNKISFHTHTPSTLSRPWKEIRHICMVCFNIVTAMKRELEQALGVKISAAFDCVTPEQLRSIIRSRPHSTHLIDKKRAQQLIAEWRPR